MDEGELKLHAACITNALPSAFAASDSTGEALATPS
jgi:hypothetical protein